MENYLEITAEEIGMDGSVSFGKCPRSTAYRHVKALNDFLKANRYDWFVRVRKVCDNPYTSYSLERCEVSYVC